MTNEERRTTNDVGAIHELPLHGNDVRERRTKNDERVERADHDEEGE